MRRNISPEVFPRWYTSGQERTSSSVSKSTTAFRPPLMRFSVWIFVELEMMGSMGTSGLPEPSITLTSKSARERSTVLSALSWWLRALLAATTTLPPGWTGYSLPFPGNLQIWRI